MRATSEHVRTVARRGSQRACAGFERNSVYRMRECATQANVLARQPCHPNDCALHQNMSELWLAVVTTRARVRRVSLVFRARECTTQACVRAYSLDTRARWLPRRATVLTDSDVVRSRCRWCVQHWTDMGWRERTFGRVKRLRIL